ncbi:hypothetical protein [Streptomyces phaeochromogenes]|uniref:hypothetical protein n=1 Tax=Streptomyces phaeochromogenes TaxID=1923 RepID=UPI0006E21E84|nr:hypothetical protein [Streptomyces phaeochromogenes]
MPEPKTQRYGGPGCPVAEHRAEVDETGRDTGDLDELVAPYVPYALDQFGGRLAVGAAAEAQIQAGRAARQVTGLGARRERGLPFGGLWIVLTLEHSGEAGERREVSR